MTQPGPSSDVFAILRIILSIAAILAFAAMFGSGMYRVWTNDPRPHEDSFIYVANILAALVGGVVAVGFGQPPPSSSSKRTRSKTFALGYFLTSSSDPKWVAFLGGVYAVVYVLYGIAAIVTWVSRPETPSSTLIKTFATTFLGLALPIITGFLRPATA